MLSSVQSPSRTADSGLVGQRTLKAAINCVGLGSSGTKVRLTFRPAPPRSGIVFHRTDLRVDAVAAEDHPSGGIGNLALAAPREPVPGAERALTALAMRGITNAVVELNSAELPVFDGTAKNFLFLIDCAGSLEQEEPATRKQAALSDPFSEGICLDPTVSAHIFRGQALAATGHHSA